MLAFQRVCRAGVAAAALVTLAGCARTTATAPTAPAAPAAPAATVPATPSQQSVVPTPTSASASASATVPATDTPAPESTASPIPTPTAAQPAAAETATPAASVAGQKPALIKVVEGLEKPTEITHAGDGSGLLYALEQPGRVRVLRDGALLEEAFLDITDRVGSSGNEQGLLGIAFAPDFAQSRRFFVNYTDSAGDTIVAGFVAEAGALRADRDSEWRVIKIDQPYQNHNGGQIKFGPDGMLYIGMGDGGSAGDPENRAQNVKTLLGKMLRIDVSASTADAPYAIPAGNPSFGAGALPEIWSIGLRNPWRFSFDRATGDLYIGDVGQNQYEEINLQPAGRGGDNYGWKLREGTHEYDGARADYFVEPIDEYAHGDEGCSVTGGYVYRGTQLPALTGAYVYGDYCSGRIWALRRAGERWLRERLFDSGFSLTAFGEDAAGEIYALDRGGAVYRIGARVDE